MPKTAPIGIRLDPAVRAALESAAKADDRSLSTMAAKLIAEALAARGWINSGGKNAKRRVPI